MDKIISLTATFCISLIMGGCYSATAPIHPDKLSTQARDASASKEIANFMGTKSTSTPPPVVLPSVYQNLSPLSGKTISISAENANLRQVLYTISQSAGLNLIIDKDVDTNTPVTLTLDRASTEEALDLLSDLADCSYVIKGSILHIKQYSQRTFAIPYIHSTTSFDSALGGDMLGSTGSTTTGAIAGKFALNYKNPAEANDFYKQIETNVKDLLSEKGKYTLNSFTGTLVVTDTKKSLDSIDGMLKKIKKSASRQVLIEAKILEVVLNDDHQLGVDWSTLSSERGDFSFSQALKLSSSGTIAGVLGYTDEHITGIINALDSAGDVETLSNPRIKVSSGQSALITSGQLIPFWDLEVTPGTVIDGVLTPALYEYTRRDVLEGLSLGVTPKITEEGQIILNIVPVTTDIVGEKGIEGTIFTTTTTTTTGTVVSAPIINIKEAGTVIQARDNDLVLIGGLISNTKKDERNRLPLLGEIPYAGALFSQTNIIDQKRELVILLKLNVIEP